MVAALENKHDAIATLCRKHGVVRMDVFGSALRDECATLLPEMDAAGAD